MTSEHVFNHEEVDDFTKDFTASPDQDYITLFIYLKGQEYDAITVGKNAAKAIVELFPYNSTNETHRTYPTANEKNVILKLEYSPAKCIPLDPKRSARYRV